MLHALYQQQSQPPSLLGELLNPAYLQARMAAIQSETSPMDKARALAGTLGIRFRTASPSLPPTQTQARFSIPIYTQYQAGMSHTTAGGCGGSRFQAGLTHYTSPAGYTVGIPAVQFA